jgi:hypothetical protein
LRLVIAQEWFDGFCQTKALLTDDAAAQSATALRSRLRDEGHDWKPLLDELGRFVDTGRNPPDEAWSLQIIEGLCHVLSRTDDVAGGMVLRLELRGAHSFKVHPELVHDGLLVLRNAA